MEVEYKKFTVVPDLEDGYSFEAYSTVKSFKKSEQAIYEWLRKLAKSVGVDGYTVHVEDATWSEATIRKDKLFETHYPLD